MSFPPFPFDVTTTVPEFLSWPMGVFSSKITNGRIYSRGRIPSLHPTSDGTNSRLVLTPHVEDEEVRDLRRGIGRLYDASALFRLIFPDPKTHAPIHHSETCLWLLKEDWYTCFVQGLMHWVHVEPSQTSALLAYGNIPANTEGVISFPAAANTESPVVQPETSDTRPTNDSPPTPPSKTKKKSWCRPGFLLPAGPLLQNANPHIPTVGLLLSSGNVEADSHLTEVFNDLQRERVD
jgi:hypothetical protein